uniref:Uncharacterized protein n=1 Tax=Cacopsylla melanoneura TaxID=428564 RepID=A0A8D9AUE1_9HEMI
MDLVVQQLLNQLLDLVHQLLVNQLLDLVVQQLPNQLLGLVVQQLPNQLLGLVVQQLPNQVSTLVVPPQQLNQLSVLVLLLLVRPQVSRLVVLPQPPLLSQVSHSEPRLLLLLLLLRVGSPSPLQRLLLRVSLDSHLGLLLQHSRAHYHLVLQPPQQTHCRSVEQPPHSLGDFHSVAQLLPVSLSPASHLEPPLVPQPLPRPLHKQLQDSALEHLLLLLFNQLLSQLQALPQPRHLVSHSVCPHPQHLL